MPRGERTVTSPLLSFNLSLRQPPPFGVFLVDAPRTLLFRDFAELHAFR